MKLILMLFSGLAAISAVHADPVDTLPDPPADMDPCGRQCVFSMYDKARQGLDGINCSNDRTPSCVCKGNNINFWNGLRDCSQQGCGDAVYQQVATWKDKTLCAKPQPTTTPTTTTPPTTTSPTPAPTNCSTITYIEDGQTKTQTLGCGRATATPTPA